MSDNRSTQDYGKGKVIVNKPIDWQNTLNLSEQVRSLRFARDKDGNIFAFPVVLFDPTGTSQNVLALGKVSVSDPNLPNANARCYGNAGAGWSDATVGIVVHATPMLLKGPPGSNLEAQRTPNVFKTLVGVNAAGATAVWTPAAGKKFRLMSGNVTLTKDAACAGAEFITLSDGAEANRIRRFEISGAALVATGQVENFPFNLPGNGYLSSAINNVLNLTLNGALTAGLATANVEGTEE